MQVTWVGSLGWEDPLEEKMETHSGTLAWRIPWTEEPGGLQYLGDKKSDMEEQLTLSLSHFHGLFYSLQNLSSLKHILTNVDLTSSSRTLKVGFQTFKQKVNPWAESSLSPSSHSRSLCFLPGLGTERVDEAEVRGSLTGTLGGQGEDHDASYGRTCLQSPWVGGPGQASGRAKAQMFQPLSDSSLGSCLP